MEDVAEITKSGSKITHLSGDWNIPAEPSSKGGQILYYWNGMQPNFYGVLQPVLQWTRSSGWAIKSWFVGDGGTVTSKAISVKSGRTIHGEMTQQSDGSWMCTGQMTPGGGGHGGSPATLHYNRPGKETFTQAFGAVLEAYSISTCDMYPADDGECTFVNNSLAFDGKEMPHPLQWRAKKMGGNCNERTTKTDTHIKIHVN